MASYMQFAKVSDNADPEGLNRVKVTSLLEEESISGWLPVLSPCGGEDAGLSFLPDVGDQVMVASLDELGSKQVVIGSIWSNPAPPPKTGENAGADLNADGKNSLRFVKSRSGGLLVLDDTDGAAKAQFISADGKSRIEFDCAEELVSLSTEHDISISAKGSVSIRAEENIEIEADSLDLSCDGFRLDAKDGFDADADGSAGINGSGFSLN